MATTLRINRLASQYVEVAWPTETGRTYQLQSSTDLATWGNEGASVTGDGSTKSQTFFGNKTHLFFRLLITLAQGYEPKLWAVVAFNGSKVTLLWDWLGPSPTGQYQIFRDNNLIAVVDGDSDGYEDHAVLSGHRYVYAVKFYSA